MKILEQYCEAQVAETNTLFITDRKMKAIRRESALIDALEKVKIRFEILKGRMAVCGGGETHELSIWELGGWIEEMEMVLEEGLK